MCGVSKAVPRETLDIQPAYKWYTVSMPNSREHDQVWTKVNAPVDRGVLELIDALSAFPKLQTVESCQGGDQTPAWVSFIYGQERTRQWRDLADFVLGRLGPALASELGDRISVLIQVHECGEARGELTVHPEVMRRTVKALKKLRRSLTL